MVLVFQIKMKISDVDYKVEFVTYTQVVSDSLVIIL